MGAPPANRTKGQKESNVDCSKISFIVVQHGTRHERCSMRTSRTSSKSKQLTKAVDSEPGVMRRSMSESNLRMKSRPRGIGRSLSDDNLSAPKLADTNKDVLSCLPCMDTEELGSSRYIRVMRERSATASLSRMEDWKERSNKGPTGKISSGTRFLSRSLQGWNTYAVTARLARSSSVPKLPRSSSSGSLIQPVGTAGGHPSRPREQHLSGTTRLTRSSSVPKLRVHEPRDRGA